MDVVKCYTDSFRAAGPGSEPLLLDLGSEQRNWLAKGTQHKSGSHHVERNRGLRYTQLTELLSNYGTIPLIAFDGYSWLTGHQQVPYQQIHALVRRLQPNAIILDHNGGVPWEVDTEYFEEPLGITAPAGNTTAGSQGQTIATDNQWFWSSTTYRSARRLRRSWPRPNPTTRPSFLIALQT